MRETFTKELYNKMKENPDIYLLTGDLGYHLFDDIRWDFQERFINCGASEYGMVGIAIGLALEGKIPFCYSITPFLIFRPFELLRTYIDTEKIPVKLIGSGRDKDYIHDGRSHDASDIQDTMNLFKNIKQLWPTTKGEVKNMVDLMVNDDKPYFISLQR